MPSTLGLVEATTSWTAATGLFRRRTQEKGYTFQDWTVDGVPLRDLLDPGTLGQETTYLTEDSGQAAVDQIDRLLGHRPPDLQDGRVALLVCPIDRDLDCGALTARLVINQDTVEWRELGWQTLSEPEVHPAQPRLTIVFDRLGYEQVLLDARTRYATSAGAKLSRHDGASLG